MKKTKLQEHKNKNSAELTKELGVLRAKLGGMKFDLAAGKSNTVKEIREIKKQIAQMLTILNERSRKESTITE
ncbi:50S ribosomal protein L29 [Candidatus Parcubacteria bacterium]|jgi:ribosomal protein L29|nr:MAG: 50S ribosomal protein L29 [Candidatus Parcubacteria bacterium]